MSTELDDAIESDKRAQWLFDHKAPLEWVILTRFEIGTIKTEMAALRDENARLKGLVVKKDEALQSINEYWNGGNGSAPDACQHACDESEKALALTPASMADFVCVKREEWDKAYGYAARIDKELDAIRILADELACALNLNKGKADHG